MTRASVLIPIHNKPTTLPLTVDTVLRQSVTDLEVILIGDGVTDEVRDVVIGLVAADTRVRFLDLPKGPHHGERYRHDAIEAARSDAIFYLCDDDLLLPDHVADLLVLLEDHDLVQSFNGWVTAAGEVRLYAGDLADPECVDLHLSDDIRFNVVSITGTAHTRQAYRELDDPWDTTPRGQWPDHWQFRKLMRRPGFRGATSRRMTALQFPTSSDGRDTWDDAARLAELEPWHALVTSPHGQDDIDRLTRDGQLAQVREAQMEFARVAAHVDWLNWSHDETRGILEATRAELRANQEALASMREHAAQLEAHVARLTDLRAEREAKIEELRLKVRARGATIARLTSAGPD